MIKYFYARVTVSTTVTVNVEAETEGAAREKARRIALTKLPGASISGIDLQLTDELDLNVGQRVEHVLFGKGTIEKICRGTNGSNETSYRTSIAFDSGTTKDIVLPLPKEKFEVIG